MSALAILTAPAAQGARGAKSRLLPAIASRETAGRMRNAKRWRRFRASFYGLNSVYNFARQILTWRPRLPLLPEFLGTSAGVPNRSHGSAATACHSVSGVDFLPGEDDSISHVKCFRWWET